MKNRLLVFCTTLSIALSSIVVQAQTTVFGYFPSYRSTNVIEYDKLTDIAFSFINPNTNGNLILSNPGNALYGFDFNKFVVVRDQSALNNVRLWIALGGADSGEQRAARLSAVSGNATTRNNLVSELVAFAIQHGCYGIDVDWEFPKTQQAKDNHLLLLQALNTEIANSSNPDLKVSVAVGGEYKFTIRHTQYVHPSLFGANADLVDKWNIMAYDFPATYGVNHSSFADAQGSMEGWNAEGVPYDKMLLGIPFYARTSNRSGELMYNQLASTNAVYTNDQSGQWYYNGRNTIEDKMDLTADKGAPGILIWDLGQDKTGQYSLLNVINDKAATLCPVPKPNLGPDKGVCGGASTTLDPQVGAEAGRTFAWSKDGGSTIGTSPTIDVTEAGVYTVEISQGGCTRSEEIEIVTGSPVTTSGATGCNDENLTLSVNNPDQSKTYIWYDAEVAGTQVNTGATYTTTFANNTTLWVEEGSDGVETYTTSPAGIPEGKFHAWAGTQFTYRVAQRIVVESDLTIKSMRTLISTERGAEFTVKVLNSDNLNELQEVGPFNLDGDGVSPDFQATLFDINVDITLTPGSYFITLEPSAGDEGNYGFVNNHNEGNAEAGVYELYEGMFQSSATVGFSETDMGGAYGPFFNWVIETGASASCGRTPVTATVQECSPPTVEVVNPTADEDFERDAEITFLANISDEGSIDQVVFEVWKGGQLLETLTNFETDGQYYANWTPTQIGSDYTLRVKATDNDANETVVDTDFNVTSPVSVNSISESKVNLFPNPSNSEFTLTLSGISNYEVSLFSISGQLLISDKVTSSSEYRFGSELSQGVYLLQVTSEEGNYQTRVIKN